VPYSGHRGRLALRLHEQVVEGSRIRMDSVSEQADASADLDLQTVYHAEASSTVEVEVLSLKVLLKPMGSRQ
jgi:hypothetical protein